MPTFGRPVRAIRNPCAQQGAAAMGCQERVDVVPGAGQIGVEGVVVEVEFLVTEVQARLDLRTGGDQPRAHGGEPR